VVHAGAFRYRDLAEEAGKNPKPPEPQMPLWLRTVVQAVALLCMANFFGFFLTSFFLGGSALEGTIQNGHYYLNAKSHRPPSREVSAAVWNFSWWQGFTALSGLGVWALVGIWAEGYAAYLERRRKRGSGRSPASRSPEMLP
jgi:hypothetical protein